MKVKTKNHFGIDAVIEMFVAFVVFFLSLIIFYLFISEKQFQKVL